MDEPVRIHVQIEDIRGNPCTIPHFDIIGLLTDWISQLMTVEPEHIKVTRSSGTISVYLADDAMYRHF